MAIGFSVLRIWSFFASVFTKTAVFRFWCLARFAGFPQFSLWFTVFVNNDCRFLDFSVQCIQYGFPGFAKKVTPCCRAKTDVVRRFIILRDCAVHR